MWDVCVEGADIGRQGLILMAAFPGLTASSTKSIVSLRYDGICTTKGRRWWSTYSEIRLVGAPHEDMIGLPGLPTLWIFGRWYKPAVRGSVGVRYLSASLLMWFFSNISRTSSATSCECWGVLGFDSSLW